MASLLAKECSSFLFKNSQQKLLRALSASLRVAGSVVRHRPKEPNDYSNFPESYIEREKEVVEWRNPEGPQYNKGKVVKNRIYNYTIHRPWEHEAKEANPRTARQIYYYDPLTKPLKSWNFFRGDRVQILAGKDKGKQGVINYMVQEMNWVIVEGLNCDTVYQGKTPTYPGLLVKVEQPLIVEEEVALVDPTDNQPTAVEWRFTEEGDEVRVSARTGRIIPVPVKDEETYDYKRKELYVEQPKDTTKEELVKISFTPKLATFEMEIMENMGIKEDRIPNLKTYWY